MAITPVNVGSVANDGTGDSLRSLAQTVNLIIAELGGVGSANPIVRLATAAALPSSTYSAGVITAAANGALTVDGSAVLVNDLVLVKDEATAARNGVYEVTDPGDGASPFILTRAGDYSTWDNLAGSLLMVQEGSANAETAWQSTADAGGTLGTTSIAYVQVSSGSINSTRWGYLAAATAFGGPLLASADLAGHVTALGGAGAVRTALSVYSAAEVDGLITALVNSASSAYDTLGEIETALAAKAPLASPALTGSPTAPTQTAGDNSTKLATTAYVETAVGAVPGLTDGDKGDITVSASGATWTIDADAVSYSKIQNVSATDRLLGRYTAGAGDIEEISLAADLAFDTGALKIAAAFFSGKTAITAVDSAADYAMVLDATDGALKKALAKYVGGVGKEAIFIEAPSWKPRPTNPCADLAVLETTTNKVTAEYLAFDKDAIEYAHFRTRNPLRYGTNTFTYAVVWAHPAASAYAVVWSLQAGGFGDSDALDTALGTAVNVTDTGGTTNDVFISPESAAVTVANLASEDFIVWQLARQATNGSDTLDVDAYFIGLILFPVTTQNTDA